MNKKKFFLQDHVFGPIRKQLGILSALLLLCILLTFLSDSFLTSRNLFNVLRQIAVNVFLACSMTIVIIHGGIDLSVGSIIALVGCVCAVLITKLGVNVFVAIGLCIIIGALVGSFNGLIASRTTLPPFIITLATMNICRGLARVIVSNKTVVITNETYRFIGTGHIKDIPIHIFFIVIAIIVSAVILNKTTFGRNVYAIGGNRTAAVYSGINDKDVIFKVFLISGIFAAFAGILSSSRTMVGQYSLGDGAEMDAITAVVLGGTSMSGGVGTIGGTIIGCLLVGVLNNGMNLLGIDSSWQYVVQGAVVLIAVLIDFARKEGVFKRKRTD